MGFSQAVDQNVEHLVPVDAGWSMPLTLVLLKRTIAEVPATGIQPVWGHHHHR
jgi:hypothetical protein